MEVVIGGKKMNVRDGRDSSTEWEITITHDEKGWPRSSMPHIRVPNCTPHSRRNESFRYD